MKRIALIIASSLVAFAGCVSTNSGNVLINGDFAAPDGWTLGPSVEIADGKAKASLDIPKYHTRWCEFFTQTVTLEPGKEYVLTAEAKSSLPVLKSSVYIGVRHPDGTVLKDMEYLLFHDDMTPMKVVFNTGSDTSVTIFCGSWANQSVEFTFDNFSLKNNE